MPNSVVADIKVVGPCASMKGGIWCKMYVVARFVMSWALVCIFGCSTSAGGTIGGRNKRR